MIPYGKQCIDDDDIQAVIDSLRSDWLTQGPAIDRFEKSLAQYCQASHAVACNSGTAALHMAYDAAGIGYDDVVVVPSNTFLATANAAVYLGGKIRFCDVDANTGLMTAEALAQVLDEDVKAIVPVHFAGQACDMAALNQVRDQFSPQAVMIEDASHAIGGRYANGQPIGKPIYSEMVTFSFHPVKHIAAGEGGAVITDRTHLKDCLVRFRCHGMTKDPNLLTRRKEGPWYYEMQQIGFNYRIPETSCALAASQMKKLPRFIARRREIAAEYLDSLTDLPHLTLPPTEQLESSAWHLFCLHVDFESLGLNRATMMSKLAAQGVGTQVHYFPVHEQPYYQSEQSDVVLPGARCHYERALSIPIFPAMQDEHVQTVVSSLGQVWDEAVRNSQSDHRRSAA